MYFPIDRDVLKYIANRGLKPAPPQPMPLPASSAPSPAAAPAAKAPAAPAARTAPPAPLVETEEYADLPLTNMRKVIAKRLTESKVQISAIPSTHTLNCYA